MQHEIKDLPTILARSRAADWWRLLPPNSVMIAVAVAVVAVVAYWYFAGASTTAITYFTQTIKRGDVTVNVRATGTIEPTDQVDISSELSGTVRSVYVDYNDTVKKGQVLAELDTETLDAQIASSRATLAARQARVREIEATVAETKAAYNRATALHRRQFLSAQGVEQARAAYDRALASLGSAKADVQTARADLKTKQTNLGKATIRSPIGGIVLDRNVEPGQTVASSLQAPVLFKLAEDLKRMQLEVDIDEADVSQVQTGDKATFWVEGFPEKTFPAQITAVRYSSETVAGVVTYKAILAIDNSELLLRPGMTATADIRVEEVKDALLVPNAALRFEPPAATSGDNRSWLQRLMPRGPGRRSNQPSKSPGTGRSVWVLVNQQTLERPLKTGVSDGTNTVVTEGSLKVGENVVVDADAGK
ncbi:MAG: efflux RND transporter periplasmic adaptor subunit [Alphaproteobacteria bacterium]|nr:efflux RND transporter periplasmic adaptor subunit [Alphaproteobacteria bacterium]